MSELTDLVETHYKGFNNHDLDLSLSVISDDVETITPSGPMKGIEAFRAFGEAFQKAAPDGSITSARMFESGDTVIVEGSFAGTHTGDLEGPGGTIPATGRSFSFPYVDIFEVKNGKVVSHRIYWDNMAFMTQLGAIPS